MYHFFFSPYQWDSSILSKFLLKEMQGAASLLEEFNVAQIQQGRQKQVHLLESYNYSKYLIQPKSYPVNKQPHT
jgi:hypothetical protein